MKLREKRGSAMVEAAMVYPLTILAVLAAVYLSVELYQQCCFGSAVHTGLREAGGRASETIFREGDLPEKKGILEELQRSSDAQADLEQRVLAHLGESPYRPAADRLETEYQRLGVFPKLSVFLEKRTGGFWLIHSQSIFHEEGRISLQDEAGFLRNVLLASEGGVRIEAW